MTRTPRDGRRSVQITALAVGVLAALLLGTGSIPVGAAGGSARDQRAAVRAEQATVAAQVDALKGDQGEVAAALAALDENVRGQQATLADARLQVEVSTAAAEQAEKEIAKTEKRIEALRQKVVAYAVEAYITPPDEDLLRRMEATSASEDATKRALLAMRSGTDADSLHRLQGAREHLDNQRERAQQSREEAERAAVRADEALTTLASARSQQQAFAQQVRARLDEKLADAFFLSQVDSALGQRIAAEQAALAAAVRTVPSNGTGGSSGSGGSSPSKVASVPRPPLTTVGGITVASSIAPQLKQLLTAAAAAGFELRGYGWRDSRNQLALRAQNCGGWTDYALYEMPPDQCSPPTARPGASMHEQGLAVDLSEGGEFIESRKSAVFKWLAAHAPTYGFRNLPSEPWHWSTTGG
ncbi:MAG TPA: D-alanyl-D-alanine carboxypeptidase family protein [Acidimicrobiales bacterium]